MTDPLKVLAEVETEDSEMPEDLRALAEGRASRAAAEALRVEADASAEAAERYDRFRPYSYEEDEALVASLTRTVARPKSAARWRWPVAVAAASIGSIFALSQSGSPLPGYRVEASDGDRALRSAPVTAQGPKHAAGSLVTILLRPKFATSDIVVDTYVLDGAALRPHPVAAEISKSGAVRIQGPVEEVFAGLDGDVTMLFVVRRSDDRRPAASEVHASWVASKQPAEYRVVAYRCRVAS